MKSSSGRSFDVYEFKDEIDGTEVVAPRSYKNPGNPNPESSAILKYELLSFGMSQPVLAVVRGIVLLVFGYSFIGLIGVQLRVATL